MACALNQDILQGKALEAFEAHYAEDVVMQENTDEERLGKELNHAHELQFFGSIEAFFGAELVAASFANDVGFSVDVGPPVEGHAPHADEPSRSAQVAGRQGRS